MNRRHFISSGLAAASAAPAIGQAPRRQPNIILMMTDDQGYGDLSLHGNPHIETPNIDSIGKDGVQFTQFHVNPVCSPTRASLMTGRYYYRTGVVDTFLGRSMMHNDETTVAELLSGVGYKTGLFGKWHLGDCYPLRSIDQGFQESLNCTGGGLTQPSDPPGNTYFDPMLRHNGKWEKHKGYCTDIFFGAAMQFIEANRARPFFTYIPTNAPHDPLQISDEYVQPFVKKGLAEREAKIYGMVKNVDDNVGRLLKKLRELQIEQDTILIFLTDNGPQSPRYNAGMRGHKTTTYEGGIRVPFLMKWPRRLQAGTKIGRLAAHIDVMPTLVEIAGAKLPRDLKIDGRSLNPLLAGERAEWKPRTLFFQWHRGDRPEPHRNSAAHDGRWKLVNGKELYDLQSDPGEQKDLAVAQPDIAKRLRGEYDAWFADVSATRNYEPPKIFLGAEQENPVTLTRQDWRGPSASWDGKGNGHWEVDVRRAGKYDITVRMAKTAAAGKVEFKLAAVSQTAEVPAAAESVVMRGVTLPKGPGQLSAVLEAGGVRYVDVERTGNA
ncbi:MAG: sulfatase-like hydrolase/transferase [Acidobacteria bacterium]|nr:sulfatase-like hydrolase/transferase [Acidobacteriota bacterium]